MNITKAKYLATLFFLQTSSPFISVNVVRSILGSSWFWMSGEPMDFSQWDEGSHHSSPCGGVSSVEPSTWRQRSCEEHLNFICFTGWSRLLAGPYQAIYIYTFIPWSWEILDSDWLIPDIWTPIK